MAGGVLAQEAILDPGIRVDAMSSDTDGRPLAGLVVCTYTIDRLPMLLDLLQSVGDGDERPSSIVVVVDRDIALAARLQAELERPGLSVLLSQAGGLSAARNVGWRALDTEWVAFVDDDAAVDKRWLSELWASMTDPQVGIVGGSVDPVWPNGRVPAWYTRRLGWVVGCSYDGLPRATANVRSVIGCNMAVRRTLLEGTGGFETYLGRSGGSLIGSEETELCVRASQLGFRIVYIPAARVRHYMPSGRTRVEYAIQRAWGEGRSKARLAAMHGPVLGLERRYSAALLHEALRRARRAVEGERAEAGRSAALLAVLGTTAVAYGVERVRSAASNGHW